MIEYPKIETPFERDTDGTKKLIEGKWRREAFDYLENNLWICTEKVDGTNISIEWDGHRVSYHGRTENAQIPAHLMNRLIDLFGGETNEQLFEQKFGEMPVILFGEGYGPKIQKGGGLYSDEPDFILFDVYLPDKNLWLSRHSVEDIAISFGIDAVPIVLIGSLKDAIEHVKKKPVSDVGKREAPMEGLVCRPLVELTDRLGKRVIVKIKVRDFAD